jgi:hypothetical protein
MNNTERVCFTCELTANYVWRQETCFSLLQVASSESVVSDVNVTWGQQLKRSGEAVTSRYNGKGTDRTISKENGEKVLFSLGIEVVISQTSFPGIQYFLLILTPIRHS